MFEPGEEDAIFDFGRGDSGFDRDGKVGLESIRVTTGFIHVLSFCSDLFKPDDVMLDLGNENEMLQRRSDIRPRWRSRKTRVKSSYRRLLRYLALPL